MNEIMRDIVLENERWSDPDYCLNMVKREWGSLKYVKSQTPRICMEALKQNTYAYRYIRLPDSEPERSEFIIELNNLLNEHFCSDDKSVFDDDELDF